MVPGPHHKPRKGRGSLRSFSSNPCAPLETEVQKKFRKSQAKATKRQGGLGEALAEAGSWA